MPLPPELLLNAELLLGVAGIGLGVAACCERLDGLQDAAPAVDHGQLAAGGDRLATICPWLAFVRSPSGPAGHLVSMENGVIAHASLPQTPSSTV